ncbi:zinc ribbon domain-containing protein [Serratia proteamaculans]|uniref:zinc ribbon domain-containing protein n=1 Tax=Serratia TaxID=613 RepID=UPI0021CAE13E|nr:zinc ribbon domain-containing protein [Serratia liquefaciens]MBN5198738.1 zinc ribbon domain-containing protein [Serratia marcescens]
MEFLVVAALLGLITAFIAQSKGRSFAGWWVYGFLLFIVAIIHVLIIPSERKHSTTSSPSSGESRDCPYCAEPIKRQASKCKHCGSDVEPLPISISVMGQIEGDGTKIHWKRVLVIVLSVTITYLIITKVGPLIK